MSRFGIKTLAVILGSIVFLLAVGPQLMAGEREHSASFGHQDMPNAQLAKEHDLTLKVAGAAAEIVERLRSGDQVEKEKLADLHDFFVNFVDACHHGKEEQYYFPVALVALPELKGTAATLKLDHDIGKALLRGIARALELWEDKEDLARRQAADNLAAYTALLQRHVDVESREMMKPAASAFSQEQQGLVREGFHYVESEQLGEGFHQKYHALAMKILGEKHS